VLSATQNTFQRYIDYIDIAAGVPPTGVYSLNRVGENDVTSFISFHFIYLQKT